MTRTCVAVCFLISTLFFCVLRTATGNRYACPNEAVLFAVQSVNKTLTSPNYPNNYDDNLHCSWRIKAPNPQSFVRLYVLDIDMERSTNCSFDSLSFYDGVSGNKLLSQFCGVQRSERVLDYGTDVVIKFKSDISITGKGFKLHYSAVQSSSRQFRCGLKEEADYGHERILTADVGRVKTLISPNYPNSYNFQKCGWKIKAAREGYVVRVYLVDLQLTGLFRDCEFYSLSLYDSDTTINGLLLAKMCGDNHNGKTYYSSGRYMYIQFETGTSSTNQGFKLVYSAVPPPTSLTTDRPYESLSLSASTTSYQYLQSENYPSSYYSWQRKFWTIRCKPGYAVQLHVDDMDLQNSNLCTDIAVTVLNSDYSVLAKMCNYQYNGVDLYSTKGQVMFVRFAAAAMLKGKGFSLRYRAVSSRQTFSGYTTRAPTTFEPGSDSKSSGNYNYVSVIIGIIGGCLLLCIIVICFRRSRTRNRQTQRPPVGRLSTATFRSGPTPAATNNGVYTVPTSQPTAPVDGYTNLAYTEDPPAYSSLQHNPSVAPSAPVPSSPEPPAYTEAMKLTYPPSYKEANDDASTQPISESSPLPRDAATPATPAALSPQPEEPTPGSDSVTTISE